MRVALVDSGGNAGLPERQAHHTQASSYDALATPHPPREVDATWHSPPVLIGAPHTERFLAQSVLRNCFGNQRKGYNAAT
jgi:hypothetical protein